MRPSKKLRKLVSGGSPPMIGNPKNRNVLKKVVQFATWPGATPIQKAILNGITPYASSKGAGAFVSNQMLIVATGFKERAVRNNLGSLETKGLIECTGYRNGGR